MGSLADSCKKLSDYLERFCLFTAGIILIINLLTVMLGVFGRFYQPPIWTTDLAKITLVWVVMLGAAPALKRGEHMAITIIVDSLPQGFHRFIIVIRTVVFFGILLIMIFLGIKYALSMHLFTIMSLNIKQTIPLMAIPTGMILMLIEYALQQFIPLHSHKSSDLGISND
ncbi:MAG: TRAP transporter small permease [Epsilonproteobacteria bacterium]|nr:TRAP transporter small permease [Campylobacterota bacterium]